MDFLKNAGGKLVSGAVALAVVVAGIAWWQATPEARTAAFAGTARIGGWWLAVLLLPWVLFLLIAWVERFKSNTAGVILVGTITLLELAVLWWLFDFRLPTPTGGVLLAAATLLAGVYNLFACDWIADKQS